MIYKIKDCGMLRIFVLCLFGCSSSLSIAGEDAGTAQEKIQGMAHHSPEQFNAEEVGKLKQIFRESKLLESDEIPPATINAVGQLVLNSRVDPEFQDEMLDRLLDRVGIDVDVKGFASLADRIDLQRNQLQRYASLPPGEKEPTADRVRSIVTARRWIGLRPQSPSASEIAPITTVDSPLAMQKPVYPKLPAVRANLLRLRSLDQAVRQTKPQSSPEQQKADLEQMQKVDAQVLSELKPLFDKYGMPTNRQVGRSGTMAAWILIMHAVTAPDLMHKAVSQAKALRSSGDLPDGPYAMLIDRVACVIDNKPQSYGTFGPRNPKSPIYCPIGQADTVNARRAAFNMPPIKQN